MRCVKWLTECIMLACLITQSPAGVKHCCILVSAPDWQIGTTTPAQPSSADTYRDCGSRMPPRGLLKAAAAAQAVFRRRSDAPPFN
jgi:hypothetical protein